MTLKVQIYPSKKLFYQTINHYIINQTIIVKISFITQLKMVNNVLELVLPKVLKPMETCYK